MKYIVHQQCQHNTQMWLFINDLQTCWDLKVTHITLKDYLSYASISKQTIIHNN